MTQKIAFVTGATGAVGPSLVDHLLTNGYRVRTYSRNTPPRGLFTGDVHHIAGDINDTKTLTQALDSVDVVFHLAALLHIENPPPEVATDYHRVNVDGSRTVAELARKAGVRRMVYFSTVKVYGVQQREPVTETQSPAPRTIYAQTKLGGEKAVQSVDNLETTILRLSAVYGPRLKGSWKRLVMAISKGRFLPIGNLRNVHSLTHVDDVARAALLVAEHPEALDRVYNVVGHETPILGEILAAIYAALGKPLPSVRIPVSLALLSAFGVEKGLALIGRRSPITRESIRQLVNDEAYSGAALRALGPASEKTLAENWRAAVE